MHMLTGHLAAVDPLEDLDDLAQRPLALRIDRDDIDRLPHHTVVETVVGRSQLFAAFSFHQAQGIDIRLQVPQHPVGHDQALDARLRFCAVLRKARLLSGHGAARSMLESIEKAAPLW